MTATPVFASVAEAADLARAGLLYLASADPAQLTAAEQAECLRDLERITAVTTAARARVLGGFTASQAGPGRSPSGSARSSLVRASGLDDDAADQQEGFG